MPASNNPISVGYASIWRALNNWPAFTAIVSPGLGTQQNAQAKGFSPQLNVQAADRTMARLLEGRVMGQPYQMNSKAIKIVMTYPLQLLTDELTIDKINLLYIVCMQALMHADGVATPGTLGVPGTIMKWEIQPGETRTKDPLTKRPSWMTALNLVLTFTALRTDFLAATYT